MQKYISVSEKLGFLLPILACGLTVVSLFGVNANRLHWGQLLAPLGLSVFLGFMLWVVFWAIPRTRHGSPIIASVTGIVIMTWMAFNWTVLPVAIILLAIAISANLAYAHIKVTKAVLLTLVALMLVVSLGQAGVNSISGTARAEIEIDPDIVLKSRPDIYFILPDRFPNHYAILESGYDNEGFIEKLRAMGFYVNDSALSSDEILASDRPVDTSRTPRFVASVLNMGVVVDIGTPYNIVSRMIKNHEVGKLLKANGYEYHHIGAWWTETEVNGMADYNYVYKSQSFMPDDELAVAVLDRSLFRYLTTCPFQYITASDSIDEIRRQQHLFQLNTFIDIASSAPSPKFTFVHLLLPHPPYVWSADGSPNTDNLIPLPEQYMAQIKYTEGYLLQMVSSIKDDNAIIIIQADEGMAYTDNELNLQLSNTQWNGVLSAWRIPGISEDVLKTQRPEEVLKCAIDSLR